jgi:hypothetical protein
MGQAYFRAGATFKEAALLEGGYKLPSVQCGG